MLSLTKEQEKTYREYRGERGYAKQQKGNKLVYHLEPEQSREVGRLIDGLMAVWSPLYSCYYTNAMEGRSDPKDSEYLSESILSPDEKFAIYLGFHSDDPELAKNAGELVIYSMLGFVKKAALEVVEKVRAPHRSTEQGQGVAYSDAIQDSLQILSCTLLESYASYDYVQCVEMQNAGQRYASYTTYLSRGLKPGKKDAIESITGMTIDTRMGTKLRILAEAIASLPDDASDAEIKKRYEDLAAMMPSSETRKAEYKLTDKELQKLRDALSSGTGLGTISLDTPVDDADEDSTLYNVIDASAVVHSEDYVNPEDFMIKKENEEEESRAIRAQFEPLELDMYDIIKKVLEYFVLVNESTKSSGITSTAVPGSEFEHRTYLVFGNNQANNQVNVNKWKMDVERAAKQYFKKTHPWVNDETANTCYDIVTYTRFKQIFGSKSHGPESGRINTSLLPFLVSDSDDSFESFIASADSVDEIQDNDEPIVAVGFENGEECEESVAFS